jgi:mannose-1-phosphate guanylyltransferase
MFIWRVDTILREMKRHMPRLHSGSVAIEKRAGTPDYEETLARIYAK